MILRRLTGHLKQRHWTAIGVELGVVVLGVFLIRNDRTLVDNLHAIAMAKP